MAIFSLYDQTVMWRLTQTVALLITANSLSAQMVPYTTTINTPMGNMTYTDWRFMPGMYGNYRYNTGTSEMYRLTVVKTDSTLVQITGLIDYKDSVHVIRYKEGKEWKTLSPAETTNIVRSYQSNGTDEFVNLVGAPTDSCWLFLVVRGAINCYAYLPEKKLEYATVIQAGEDSDPVPLTKENLAAIVGEDERWLKMLKKGKLTKVIKEYNKEMTAKP